MSGRVVAAGIAAVALATYLLVRPAGRGSVEVASPGGFEVVTALDVSLDHSSSRRRTGEDQQVRANGRSELSVEQGTADDRLAVVVIDERGGPIEGARVERPGPDGVVRTTDERGRAVLPSGSPSELAHLHVSADGFFASCDRHEPRATIRVVLPPSEPLDGLLYDYERQALVAGEVRLDGYWRDTECPAAVAVAGEDGEFRFASTPGGREVTLDVRAAGYPRLRFRLDGRREPRVLLPLAQGVELALRVVSMRDGEPLVGAEVFAQGGGEFRTDADGRARPRLLDPDWFLQLPDHGYQDLVVRAEGHLTMTFSVDLDAFDPEHVLSMFLPPPARVVGTVVDEGGRPVSGARVTFRPAVVPGVHHPLLGRMLAGMGPRVPDGGYGREHLLVTVETDARGRFDAAGLVPELPDYLDEVTLDGRVLAKWLPVGTGDPGSTAEWHVVTHPEDPERARAERQP